MLDTVFATTTTTVSNGPGRHTVVHEGEHWWASDPIVKAHPDLFTSDARRGMCSSVALPDDEEPSVDEPTVEEATAAVEAAQKQLDEAKARAEAAAEEAKEKADAGKSQAPVEQATKAPGEKRTTRRG